MSSPSRAEQARSVGEVEPYPSTAGPGLDTTSEEQAALFTEVFNMVSAMMQGTRRHDLLRAEPKQLTKFNSLKFKGTFLQLPVRQMPQPLHLSVGHRDYGGLGVQIYWSRKSPNPSLEDCEGCFKAVVGAQKKEGQGAAHDDSDAEPSTFTIHAFGESAFTAEFVYLGVYAATGQLPISLAYSFKTKSCAKIVQREMLRQLGRAPTQKSGAGPNERAKVSHEHCHSKTPADEAADDPHAAC